MDLQLKDKTALISGSTEGIGFAIARQLKVLAGSLLTAARVSGPAHRCISKRSRRGLLCVSNV